MIKRPTCSLLLPLLLFTACGNPNPVPQNLSPAVVIRQRAMDTAHEQLAAKLTATHPTALTGPGLIGAMGHAQVMLHTAGNHEVLLPMPQLTDDQIPLCYYIRSRPSDAAIEYQFQRREKLNDVVRVKLRGQRKQEVQLDWSAVVLIVDKPGSAHPPLPDAYRSATACVQSDSASIQTLAVELWPENGDVAEYAHNIQQHVREMKRIQPPRSLDALEMLDSGANEICTANANLALALMRAKAIPARSMAVIPPIAQRLEMHRIVEYGHEGQTQYFDPSSLHAEVPMNAWQTVIMAKTTIADENLAMEPRMGVMRGCPYAQELELLTPGVTFSGQDFFWTIAKPLADIEPDAETVSAATAAWKQSLQQGVLSEGQIRAAAANNAMELADALQAN